METHAYIVASVYKELDQTAKSPKLNFSIKKVVCYSLSTKKTLNGKLLIFSSEVYMSNLIVNAMSFVFSYTSWAHEMIRIDLCVLCPYCDGAD